MHVSMSYGDGEIEFDLPDAVVGCHLGQALGTASQSYSASSWQGTPKKRPELAPVLFERALEQLDRAGFEAAARGKLVGLLLCDGTRDPIGERLLPSLWPRCQGARGLRIFVCTGTHDPQSPENRALSSRLRQLLRTCPCPAELDVHDCRHSEFSTIGRTRRGTPVTLNRSMLECDAFLALSICKHHYFAGYSNPIKHYLPGVAALESVRGNHALTFDPQSSFGRHPWHSEPELRTNPLAQDQLEGFELAVAGKPHFAVVVVGDAREIEWAGAGPTREVTARAMDVVDEHGSFRLEPARFLVVSPGGAPHDESLYTAQRALELSQAAVAEGGEVLFLARCPNGVGPRSARENFFEPLARPLEEVRKRPEGPYVMYSHKSYKFAHYLKGLGALHFHSELDAREVERIHLRPAPSPAAVIERWLQQAGPTDRIHFIDAASRRAIRSRAKPI